MGLRGKQNRGDHTPLLSQIPSLPKMLLEANRGISSKPGMNKLETANFNSPPSTGSQCKVGLGQNEAVINEETEGMESYRAIPS